MKLNPTIRPFNKALLIQDMYLSHFSENDYKLRLWFCYRWKIEKASTAEKFKCCSFAKQKAKVEIYETMKINLIKRADPYKHSTWIPRWNDVETSVSMSFQRGIHVECL